MFRKIMLIVFAMSMSLLFAQCSDKATEAQKPEVRQLTVAEQELVGAGNTFGLKLFREVAALEPDTNLFISPLSVAMTLGMTYNGARAETQAAMQEVLGLQGMSIEDVNKSYRSLIDLLRNLDPAVKFQIANSIWYKQGFSVEQDFLDLNRTYFDAVVEALDFEDPSAVVTINNWVDENTNGKIPTILDEIPDLMRMYLINAIYFLAEWSEQFDPKLTHQAVFMQPSSSMLPCRMMSQPGKHRYLHGDGFAAVDLPYGNGDYSMSIFLPDNVDGMNDLIESFTDENWQGWVTSFHEQAMDINLPKFELEYELRLNDALSALGMGIAFAPGYADFTGISRTDPLFISEVKHKTYVKVDENGTEAAAVTSGSFGTTSVPPSWYADHPFIYVIRESTSGTILFIGVLTEPHWPE